MGVLVGIWCAALVRVVVWASQVLGAVLAVTWIFAGLGFSGFGAVWASYLWGSLGILSLGQFGHPIFLFSGPLQI